jgi:NAD-dependent deacetylase
MFIKNLREEKEAVVIFTGAGISAESGISTFRDSNGLWENHDIKEICNELTYLKNLELVNKFYSDRREQLNIVKPNETHYAIKRIQDKLEGIIDVYIITQNVDDLLERAGCTDVLHVHGDLTQMTCLTCNSNFDIGYNRYTKDTNCPHCNKTGNARPNIVFFYGQAPMYKYMNQAFDKLRQKNSILIVSGTSGNVISLDNFLYDKKNKLNILNNMEKSDMIKESNFHKIFYEPSSTAFLKIEEYLDKLYLT